MYYAHVCSATQSGLILFDSKDCYLPGSSDHNILQESILKWAAISYPGDLPDSGTEPVSFQCRQHYTAGGFFTTEPPGKPPQYVELNTSKTG